MQIEYLGDYSRASSGQDVRIEAIITDNGDVVATNCQISLWNGTDVIFETDGEYNDGVWAFVIPASVTIELHGLYYYAISNGGEYVDVRQPITII